MNRPAALLVVPLLGVAAMVAVLLGGVLTPPTQADRVERIAEQLRCPVCDGESVAQSDSLPSLEIRQEIAERVAAGETDREILDHFAQRYGTWILNAPPRAGWLRLAWAAPALVLLAGAAAAAVWMRRSAATAATTGGGARRDGIAGDDRATASSPAVSEGVAGPPGPPGADADGADEPQLTTLRARLRDYL